MALVSFILNSCKKAEVDSDTQSAVDNGICEQEFVKVAPSANGKAIQEKGVNKMFSAGCPETYVDPADSANGFPTTMWMYYDTTAGGTGCVGDDGKSRKGSLEVIINQAWSDSVEGNNILTVHFHDYFVGGIQYDGTVMVSKPSRYAFRTQIINGTCHKPNGWQLSWDCDRTITKIQGMATPEDESDDKYSITGTANGTNRNGKTYTANITTALVKATTCAWIESGVLDITPQDRPTRSLDYGTVGSGCNNDATVTINGNTYTLELN